MDVWFDRVWADQSVRHHDLGDGHVEASDWYHDKLTHQPPRRQDVIQVEKEWERNKRCSEPCEGHDRLVEDGREPSLPSGQRNESMRRETQRDGI